MAGWNGDILFVYLPEYQTLARPSHKGIHHDRVLEVVAKAGIPMVDITPVMASDADPLNYFPFHLSGGHYTEAGYQLVADQVLDYLKASHPQYATLLDTRVSRPALGRHVSGSRLRED